MSDPAPEIVTSASRHALKHEYYLLRDEREINQIMSHAMMFDDDPARTERLKQRYEERVRAKHPSWRQGEWNPECKAGIDTIRLDIGHLSPVQAFNRKSPKNVSHLERLEVYGPNLCSLNGWSDTFDCVSTQWKEAIEDHEPGTHEFHPIALKFADGVHFDRYLFRTIPIDEFIDYKLSDVREGTIFLKNLPTFVALRRAKINERHWLMQTEAGGSASLLAVSSG